MTVERRQITEKEKEKILKKHGRVCFVDGVPIPDEADPTGEIRARLARDNEETCQALFEEQNLTVQWVLEGVSPTTTTNV